MKKRTKKIYFFIVIVFMIPLIAMENPASDDISDEGKELSSEILSDSDQESWGDYQSWEVKSLVELCMKHIVKGIMRGTIRSDAFIALENQTFYTSVPKKKYQIVQEDVQNYLNKLEPFSSRSIYKVQALQALSDSFKLELKINEISPKILYYLAMECFFEGVLKGKINLFDLRDKKNCKTSLECVVPHELYQEICKYALDYYTDKYFINFGSKATINKKILKNILALGIEVNARGGTFIHSAVTEEQDHVLKLLIKRGADVNVRNYTLQTPLHNACLTSNMYIIRILLANGAITNSEDIHYKVPLDYMKKGIDNYNFCENLFLEYPSGLECLSFLFKRNKK